MTAETSLDLARKQIDYARQYTLGLLAGFDDADWFRQPAGCDTHLAWQVGHLAMAEYGLCLFRIRGRQESDLQLMPSGFRKKFARGSTPDPDPANHLSPAEIREVFDRVHRQVILELAAASPEAMNEPIDEPYAIYPTKLGGLLYCATHEMLHAGQIGLLRRLLGKAPLR